MCCTNCIALRCTTLWALHGERARVGAANVQGGCGRAQPHTPTTIAPQSWPTHPPHLHHKPTIKVAGFVANFARVWLQALAAMVRAKCGRLPHFDHTPPHTHHKVWRKCGGPESITCLQLACHLHAFARHQLSSSSNHYIYWLDLRET